MTRAPRPYLATLLTAAVPLACILGACGGQSGDQRDATNKSNKQAAAGPSCTSIDTTAVGLAVRDFITVTQPLAKRYLSAVGTDSAVPEDGFAVLQEKGPTYFYSSDTVAQRKIREKLEEVGPYPSMLVVFRGKTETNDGSRVTVRLGGHYVGGDDNGKVAPNRSYEMACDSIGWKIASSKADAGA